MKSAVKGEERNRVESDQVDQVDIGTLQLVRKRKAKRRQKGQ